MPKSNRVKISVSVALLIGIIFVGYNALSGTDNPVIISDNVLTFAVGDVNSDTYPDIIAGVSDAPLTHNLRLFLNKQNGTFSDATNLLIVSSQNISLTIPAIIKLQDINNDGFLDIIALDQNKHSSRNLIFVSSGNGVFQESDNIIDKTFFTTSAIDVAFQNDQLILINPAKPFAFTYKDGYLSLASDIVLFGIEPDKPIFSLDIDLSNDGAPESLQITDGKLIVNDGSLKTLPNVPALSTLGVESLQVTQATPWQYKIAGSGNADTISIDDFGAITYFELDATAPDYVWGNILVLYDATKLECVSIEESFDWPAFWVWWTEATGRPEYGGGGDYYYYDQIANQNIYDLGSDWAQQWKTLYGPGVAGPVGTADPTYGQSAGAKLALANRLGFTGTDTQKIAQVNKLGAVRLYTSTYAGGLYGAKPLRIGFRINHASKLDFWCLANDSTAYTWVETNLDSLNKSTVKVKVLTLSGLIKQLEYLLLNADIVDPIRTYLTTAKNTCQEMVTAMNNQNYQEFLTKMPIVMDNIARAAREAANENTGFDGADLDDLKEQLYDKLDALIVLGKSGCFTKEQSYAVVTILRDTALDATNWGNYLNILKMTNGALDTYLTGRGDKLRIAAALVKNIILSLNALTEPRADGVKQSLFNSILTLYQAVLAGLNDNANNSQQKQTLETAINTATALAQGDDYIGALDTLIDWSDTNTWSTQAISGPPTPAQTHTPPQTPTTAQMVSYGGASCVVIADGIKGGQPIKAEVKAYTYQKCGKNRLILMAQNPNGGEVRDTDHLAVTLTGTSLVYGDQGAPVPIYGRHRVIITDAIKCEWTAPSAGTFTSEGASASYTFPELAEGGSYTAVVLLTIKDEDTAHHEDTDELHATITAQISRANDVYTMPPPTVEYVPGTLDEVTIESTDDTIYQFKDVAIRDTGEDPGDEGVGEWDFGSPINGNLAAEVPDYIPVNKPVTMTATGWTDADDDVWIYATGKAASYGFMAHVTKENLPDVMRYKWEETTSPKKGEFLAPPGWGEEIAYQATAHGNITLRITPDNFTTQAKEISTTPLTKNTTAVSLDLKMTDPLAGDISEDNEESPGAYIYVNNDDDDGDNIPDMDDDKPVNNDNEIITLTLTKQSIPPNQSRVYLEAVSGADKIKVYRIQGANWQKIIGGSDTSYDWSPTNMPATLKLEGVNASDNERDVVLKLRYEYQNKPIICDIVRITVMKVDLDINRLSAAKANWGLATNWVPLTELEENGGESDREDFGGLVGLNGDDDNHDYVTDKDQKDASNKPVLGTDENDLVPIDVSIKTFAAGIPVKLTINSGANKIRIWNSANVLVLGKDSGQTELQIPLVNGVATQRLWVEGVDFSASKNDITIRLERNGFHDDIRLTVIGIEIKVKPTVTDPTTQFIGLISASGKPANMDMDVYVPQHPRVYAHVYTAGMALPGPDYDVDLEIYSYNTGWQITNQNNLSGQEVFKPGHGPGFHGWDDVELQPNRINPGHYWNIENDGGIWAVDSNAIEYDESSGDESESVLNVAGGEIVVRLWEDLPDWTGIRPPGWMMDVVGIVVIDSYNAITDHVQIARWDNAYGPAPAYDVRNDAAPANNFIDLDPEHFFIQITDFSKNTITNVIETITTIRIATLTESGNIDDNLSEIDLIETGANTGVFRSRSQLLMSPDLPIADNPDDDFSAHDGVTGLIQDDPIPPIRNDRTHRATIDGKVKVEYQPATGITLDKNISVFDRDPEERRILQVRVHVFNEPPGVDINGDGVINTVLGTQAQATTHVNAQIERANIAWAQAGIKVIRLGDIIFENAPNDATGTNILVDRRFLLNDEAEIIFRSFEGNMQIDILDVWFVCLIWDPSIPPPYLPTANAIAYPPANRPFDHGEFSFTFIGLENNILAPGLPQIPLDLQYRTLAHEIGHLLTNQPESPNLRYIFFPARQTYMDNNWNSYRRITEATATTSRTLRDPPSDLNALGNRMLLIPNE
ncbi:VCBS repeat-containing protein [Candidatus Woesearchaeota archaeon]|nr:VCBS repeat-containing protein [Candidatus Woesearchaeota archaeon]